MSGRVPPSSRAKSRPRKYPSRDTHAAAGIYERFCGHEAEIVGRARMTIPRAVAVIGTLDAVEYTTVRDGETQRFRHPFHVRDRPLLCVGPGGKPLFVIGGRYRFTERGIVDKSDK